MWTNIITATPEALKTLSDTHNEELHKLGSACVAMTKLGAPLSVYALAGRLVGSKSGWLLLEVPNALIRGCFSALHEAGAELPPNFDGHITVMRKEEVEQIGGLDKVTERGKSFKYQLGHVQAVNPIGWPEFTKCWFVKVRSPELERLRKSYGLSAKPKNNEHDFHITIAVRRKSVLQENDVSKAAVDLTHEIASETGTDTNVPAIKQEAKKPRVRVFMPTNGHFLLQRAISNPNAARIPGGGVEPGESNDHAIHREINEEFGKRPAPGELKYLGADPRKQFPHEYYYLWKQHGLNPGTYQASNDPDEIVELVKRRAAGRNYWGPPVSHFGLHKYSNWMDKLQPDGTIEQPSKQKVIYIVRHGKTEMNSGDPNKDRIRGWKDVPLSEEGKHEAKRLGQILKDVKPTHIYSSNLSRTEDTAKEISKTCGCSVECDQAMRPWHVGKYQGHISAKVHPILAEHAKNKPDEVLEGGESFNQFKNRYLGFLKRVMDEVDANSRGPVIIVCHFRNCKLTQAWVKENCTDNYDICAETFLRNDLPTGAVLKLTKGTEKGWTCELEASAGEEKGNVKSSAAAVIIKAISGRYGLVKEADDKHIGHYEPKEKVTRQAFSYLPPKGDHDNFAQCSTCRAWTGSEHNTCVILGKEHVTGEMSCNYYQHGKPSPSGAGKEHAVLTPKQAGLVHRPVRCENCAFFDHEGGYCELYERLNEEYPNVFDLDKGVDAKGCCNFQTPKGPKVKEDAKEAALWYLNDELSKEKAASANRISLTVIDPLFEKEADIIQPEKKKKSNRLFDFVKRHPYLTTALASTAIPAAAVYAANRLPKDTSSMSPWHGEVADKIRKGGFAREVIQGEPGKLKNYLQYAASHSENIPNSFSGVTYNPTTSSAKPGSIGNAPHIPQIDNKYEEALMFNKHAPGAMPISKPIPAGTNLSEIQAKLKDQMPGGYVIKDVGGGQSSGRLVTDSHNLSQLAANPDTQHKTREMLNNLVRNPGEAFAQEKLPINQMGMLDRLSMKLTGRPERGSEYRVHTVGPNVVMSQPRFGYASQAANIFGLKSNEARQAEKFVSEQVAKLPAEFQNNRALNVDVAMTPTGPRIVESNPSGFSGFLHVNPGEGFNASSAINSHMLRSNLEGRTTVPLSLARAGAAGVAGLGAGSLAYGAGKLMSKAAPEEEPIKQADLLDTAKRVGLGLAGAGAIAGAGKMLYTGFNRGGTSLLDMGHRLWTEPENKNRLAGAFDDPAQAEQIFNLAAADKNKFHGLLTGKAVTGIDPAIAKRVHEITYGNALPYMKSQPGDILLSGSNPKAIFPKIQRFTIGSSITHADTGTPSGNWAGTWSHYLKDRWALRPFWRNKEKAQADPMRLVKWDEPYPLGRWSVGLRPKQEFRQEGGIDREEFSKWMRENTHTFSNKGILPAALREILPEFHRGTGSHVAPDATPESIDTEMMQSGQKEKYQQLRESGYTPRQAAEICSTFVAKTVQKFNPRLIPGNYSRYMPSTLMKLTKPDQPYRVHKINLPEHMQSPGALKREHRSVKYGPALWRLPVAGALAAGGGYALMKALEKKSILLPLAAGAGVAVGAGALADQLFSRDDPSKVRGPEQLPTAQRKDLLSRFEAVKKVIAASKAKTGTPITRAVINKQMLSKDDLKNLGYVPSRIAVPESGQSEWTTWRHPDHGIHFHSHGENWTGHDDKWPSMAMIKHKNVSTLKRIAEMGRGLAHVAVETPPGVLAYMKQMVNGERGPLVPRILKEDPNAYLGAATAKAAAQHDLEAVKIKRRDKEVCICPHCGKEMEEKDIYTDKKGWKFHRSCFTKGKGSIKISTYKRAFSGGLGSNAVGGQTATDPPRPTEYDGSTQSAKIGLGGSLFDTMGDIAGTEETQQPLDDVGVSYRTSASSGAELPSNGYQPSSSTGAQGHTQLPGREAMPGSGAAVDTNMSMSAPIADGNNEEDLGDVKVDTNSSTANYGQVPHLSGPGGFVP